jgi:hypothetical protein
MTTQTTDNGRTRKSLAGQIDRLDTILDGLSEGLNESVAEAVKEAVGIAVREAVQAVFTEILMNPAILAKMQPKAAVPSKPKITLRQRLATLGKGIKERCCGAAQRVKTGCQRLLGWLGTCSHQSIHAASNLLNHTRILGRFKWQLLMALVVGTLVAAGAYFASPWLAVAVSGVGGFATTLSVQMVIWLRKMFDHLHMAGG